MAHDPTQFLRGTFYRWTQLFPKICPHLFKSSEVLAVGDLHMASFGTWRDGFGRLIWGVDDFDEAYPLPYTNDLVRLGVSAVIDAKEGEIAVGVRNVCDVIVEGYREGLASGGRAFVLEEKHKWLRRMALRSLDVPSEFWKKLDALPTARTDIPRDARQALKELLPDERMPFRVATRVAGVGSLGHPRYVAIADWQGGRIALEAKAATPSACVWARPSGSESIRYQTILDRAVRCPDPFVHLCGKWLVRQLAPDSSPIEIESMRGQGDQGRLLHAMAREAANIHLGTSRAGKRILDDLKKKSSKWLRLAVKDMANATIDDWKEWRRV
jgi:uncharacterized protein (DUF2252 family)